MSDTVVLSQKLLLRSQQMDAKYESAHSSYFHEQYASRFNSSGLSSLAQRFRENWLRCPENFRDTDDSLTNLTWLFEMSPLSLEKDDQIQNSNVCNRPLVYMNSEISWQPTHPYAGSLLDPQVRMDYRTKWTGKPPFSYASLICLAMRELGKPKVTLSDIYGWIMNNFAYYRHTDSSWQNSVRHNLSLNKCFEKVPREKGERGKGGFWRVNPRHADWLEANLAKCRRAAPPPGPPPPIPRSLILEKQSNFNQAAMRGPGFNPLECTAYSYHPSSAASLVSASLPSPFSPNSLGSSSSRSPNSFSSASSTSPFGLVNGMVSNNSLANPHPGQLHLLPTSKSCTTSAPVSVPAWNNNSVCNSTGSSYVSESQQDSLKHNVDVNHCLNYESPSTVPPVRRRKTPPCSSFNSVFPSKSPDYLLEMDELSSDSLKSSMRTFSLRNKASYAAFTNRKKLALSSKRTTVLSSNATKCEPIYNTFSSVKGKVGGNHLDNYIRSSKYNCTDDSKDSCKDSSQRPQSKLNRMASEKTAFSRPRSASSALVRSVSCSLRKRRMREAVALQGSVEHKQNSCETPHFPENLYSHELGSPAVTISNNHMWPSVELSSEKSSSQYTNASASSDLGLQSKLSRPSNVDSSCFVNREEESETPLSSFQMRQQQHPCLLSVRRQCQRVETQIRHNDTSDVFGYHHNEQELLEDMTLPSLNSNSNPAANFEFESQSDCATWRDDFLDFEGVLPWQTVAGDEQVKLTPECGVSDLATRVVAKSPSSKGFPAYSQSSTTDVENSNVSSTCEVPGFTLPPREGSSSNLDSGVASLINPSDGLDLGPLDLDFETVSSALNEMVEATGPMPLGIDFTLSADLSSQTALYPQKIAPTNDGIMELDDGIYNLSNDCEEKFQYNLNEDSSLSIHPHNGLYLDWNTHYGAFYEKNLFDLNSKA